MIKVKDIDNIEVNNLKKVSSNNVAWEYKNDKEEKEAAIKLHEHILNTIIDTINNSGSCLGDEIVISIANYVRNGVFANRGGYGKLRLLSDNYEKYLSQEIENRIDKKFKIKLVHDGTAMAAAFSGCPSSVCISLGTAFGVGFPKKNLAASIIIPSYNRCDLLKGSLESICHQNINKELFEVIVVDDGSTDGTKEMVDSYKDKLNLKYFYQEHVGFRVATARNLGISNSEGKVCMFVDSGVLLASNAVEENIKIHSANENYAVIGYMYGFDEYAENAEKIKKANVDPSNVDKYIEILRKQEILDMREPLYRELGDDLSQWPAPWAIFWTGYVSVKREVLIKVGMFDESFNSWGGEDVDLGISLYTHRVKFKLDRKMNSIHMPHEKFKTTLSEEQLKESKIKKREYMHKKYNLKETKLYIHNSSSELNRMLFDKA